MGLIAEFQDIFVDEGGDLGRKQLVKHKFIQEILNLSNKLHVVCLWPKSK